MDGVFPLAPSFDTLGWLARDSAGLIEGMKLLDPTFETAEAADLSIGFLRLPEAKEELNEAVRKAIEQSGFESRSVEAFIRPKQWWQANRVAMDLIAWETAETIGPIVRDSNGQGIGCLPVQAVRFARLSSSFSKLTRRNKLKKTQAFQEAVNRCFLEGGIDFIVLPTLLDTPPETRTVLKNPLQSEAGTMSKISPLAPVNLLGLPAVALPLDPLPGNRPVSLQLIGPHNSEAELLAAARMIELSRRNP